MTPREHAHPLLALELLRFQPGGHDRPALVSALERWVSADAMKQLAKASGWTWPKGSTEFTVSELAKRSMDWDFRGRLQTASLAGRGYPERHALTSIPAHVAGKLLDEDLISSAAAELGLSGGHQITGSFTHVVVLGGMARACLTRTREAARRADDLAIGKVAVLTAHRLLGGDEPTEVRSAGWGELELETEAAVAAAREVFGLAKSPDSQTEHRWGRGGLEAPDAFEPGESRRRRSWAHLRWRMPGREIEVVAAPSGEPSVRRTSTADQLGFWAERARIGESDRLLLVTHDHYVPAQHLEAIRAVASRFGCGVQTCGVEWVSTGRYRGAAYLQELRSTLLAARRLINAVNSKYGR